MKWDYATLLGFGLAAIAAFPVRAKPPQIQNLGVLPECQFSYGYSLSGDGSVVAGFCESTAGVRRAYRWTQGTGMVDIGTLGGTSAVAFAVSADGTTIVGDAFPLGGIAGHAFKYSGEPMVDLGVLSSGGGSTAYDANSDATVIVGWSYTSGYGPWRAFRWTQADGMVEYATANSYAIATNTDGSVVVGHYRDVSGYHKAMRWTSPSAGSELGTLGGHESRANDVSADGNVIVGFSGTSIAPTGVATHAYRWTAAGGLEDLGTLGGMNSYAYRVSQDGEMVFGAADLPPPGSESHAFIWTRENGMRDLHDVLASRGVDLGDWQLTSVGNMSQDGRALIGTGRSGGAIRAWLVTGISLDCDSDYNCEGDEGDVIDLLDFLDDFGGCEGEATPCGQLGNPDVNGDAIVDILDFLDFLEAFGTGC